MKKILFLGAAPTQMPALRYALNQGHYVITCDYLADNPGHQLAHESHVVSTTDMEGVLAVAQRAGIDGIVAYATDPAAPTAAYVAEQMGLPGNPYQSVLTLARKDLFRDFLSRHGFQVPRSAAFADMADAAAWAKTLTGAIFVKPVDSSGSKGVTRVVDLANFNSAFEHAASFSRAGKVIVEEEIIRKGPQVAGDGFVVDGQLAFRCWADENFDELCNGLVPIGESFPSSFDESLLAKAHAETQRMLDLLGIKQGALNFDFVFTLDDEVMFLELGPRNGGCLIPEVIRYATQVDTIAYTVDAAIGQMPSELQLKPVDGFWASYMVHALADGVYDGLWISDRIKPKIVEQNVWVAPGARVHKYIGSNHILGTMIIRFESHEEMLQMMGEMEKDIRVMLSN